MFSINSGIQSLPGNSLGSGLRNLWPLGQMDCWLEGPRVKAGESCPHVHGVPHIQGHSVSWAPMSPTLASGIQAPGSGPLLWANP